MNLLFLNLLSATHGNGPSCTRLVYLINGVASCFCSLFGTIGGTIYYCATGKADPIYWTAIAAMWTATLGFGAKAKSDQQKVSKELILASTHGLIADPAASH